MSASSVVESAFDVESFIHEYYTAWGGTDEDLILSYFAENVVLQIPGLLIEGKEALRDQLVRPFITAFPGNQHVVKNMTFGNGVVTVEFSFQAQHKGPFAGHVATGARVTLPSCGVYEYDSAKRQITAARIYFDMGTLLQIITDSLVDDREEEPLPSPTSAVTAPVEGPDLATVIRVSQAVSSQIVLEKLVDTVMLHAMEHAGADRGLLFLLQGNQLQVKAEATTDRTSVVVRELDQGISSTAAPESL